MNEKYHIEKVGDFLKVPEDRLHICLAEFAACIELVHEVRRKGIPAGLNAFNWTDDDNPGITAAYTVVECSCCHQVVWLSQAVLKNGQELCPGCAGGG